jgi:hypothetical protein
MLVMHAHYNTRARLKTGIAAVYPPGGAVESRGTIR